MATFRKNLRQVLITLIRFSRVARLHHIWSRLYHDSKRPAFRSLGASTVFMEPFYCGNPQYIDIGADCKIGPMCDFGVVIPSSGRGNYTGRISLGSNVFITRSCQIYSAVSVEIGDEAMIAGNVFICDYSHGIGSMEKGYWHQDFVDVRPIKIGRSAWVGQSVVVMPGVTIGDFAVVGANSVVAHSLPARCIAQGSPARVIEFLDGADQS